MYWKIGLNFYSDRVLLFNPADLEIEEVKAEIENHKYHIYIICKRKKIHFESTLEKDEIGYSTFFYLNEKFDKVFLKYKHPISELKINDFKDGYYNIDTNLEKNVWVKDYLMINNLAFLVDDVTGDSVAGPLPSDLEVMYIGQAFGRTESRKIDYRIANHEKIQKIALEILNVGSNEEVLIIGVKVSTSDLGTSFVKLDSNTSKPTLQSLLDLRDKASKRISEGQEITVFEASLIKFFQPKLNTEYKITFPSPDFKSYDEIFETDFDYSAVTIDTNPVGARIFSSHVGQRKYVHYQHFPLRTKSDKKHLFEYLIEE
jgi:hypothetical protein